MPRQAIAPVYPLWRRAGRFAVISLDMEKFAAPGTIACVAARMFLLLLLLFQKKKKKKKKKEEKKKKKKRKGENEKRPEISAEYLCVLKSFLLLTRTRILNGALPRESSHVSSPITETRHCARTHTRARTHARTHALYRSKSNRASERSRDRDTGLRLSCDLAIYSSEQREPRHADCTRVLFTRMNEATRAQPWPWTRSAVKRKPGEKGAIPPVPPLDCNNAFRAVHKPCKRYLGKVVPRRRSCFSFFPYYVIGYSLDPPRTPFPPPERRARVRYGVHLSRAYAQPPRDKYR